MGYRSEDTKSVGYDVRRRDVLRTAANAVALPVATGKATAQSGDFGPLGSVHVDGARDVVLSRDGRTAYVAATDGFVTISLADPASPRILAERRDLLAERPNGPLDGIHDVKVDGDRLLVVGPAGSGYESIAVAVLFDVSDPSNPVQKGVYEATAPIHNAFLANGVAYLCTIDHPDHPLVVLDGATMTELGRWSLPAHDPRWGAVPAGVRPIHDVYVHQDRAYVALWDAGTWVLDVRDPASPSVVTTIGGRPPDTLDDGGLETGIAYTELPGNHHYSTVDDSATLLGIGKEAWDDPSTPRRGGPAGIELWDVAAITSPKPLSTLSPPPTPDPTRDGVWTHAHNFEFAGDGLYTSWFRGGVRVYDVSDPSRPVEVAAWRDSSGGGLFSSTRASFWAARVAVPGSFFVASAWEGHDGNSDPRLFTFPDPLSAPETRSSTASTRAASGGASSPERTQNAESGDTSPAPNTDGGEEGGSSAAPDAANESPPSGVSRVEGPGFGAFAALCALGLGVWGYLRRR